MGVGPSPELPPAVVERLEALLAARDRANMEPTIAALLPILEAYPENARVLYEVGGAYDTAGEEATARGYYERALAAGLGGDERRRCFLQYGSTLRNLGELEASLAVFEGARGEFPGSASLRAFEAITLHAAGRSDEAVAALLEVAAEHVGAEEIRRYVPALLGKAAWIREQAAAAVEEPRRGPTAQT